MAQSTATRFRIEGMHCAGCVARIEQALKNIPQVEDVSVNLANKEGQLRSTSGEVPWESIDTAVQKAGYQALPITRESSSDDEERATLRLKKSWRNWLIAAGLALPVVIISMADLTFPGRNWLLLVLTAPIVLWYGWPLWVGGWRAVRNGAADMNTLIALGSGTALAVSVVATIAPQLWPHGHQPNVFFEAAASIVVLVGLGRLMEERANWRTSAAVRKLVGLQAKQARVVRDGQEVDVPVEEVVAGDEVRIRPGERIPVDGEVRTGQSLVDQALLTGEPVPVLMEAGSTVRAGTINQTGSLTVTASHGVSESLLQQIINMVQSAQGSKAPIARLADHISAYFVPAVLSIALITWATWWWLVPVPDAHSLAWLALVGVLIIACPCALGLATPTAIMVAVGRGAELGVLIKSGATLERLRGKITIAFDKTGTLTRGRPELTRIVTTASSSEDDVLTSAAALEQASEHPLAWAVVNAAKARSLQLPEATGFEATPGQGIRGEVSGQTVLVGTATFLSSQQVELADWEQTASEMARQGETPLWVACDGQLVGLIAVADPIKPNAAEVVAYLKQTDCEVVLISGDRRETAEAVAKQVGITHVEAEILPQEKAAVIQKLKQPGTAVVMVGDGINDAPALAEADVGLALSSGTDIAVEASDVTLLGSDLSGVATAVALSRQTFHVIWQNLAFAFVYNVMAIPAAAGVFYSLWPHLLDPMLASGAMAFSDVSVITNSLRLKRFQAPLKRSQDAPPEASAETRDRSELLPVLTEHQS